MVDSKQCEYCNKELNIGKRFCSKECYRLFRSHKEFRIPHAYKFPKGYIFRRSWTEDQKKMMAKYSREGIVGMKGKKHSEKTKEKMSQKAFGNKNGKGNFGNKLTEERKRKISASKCGIKIKEWNEYKTSKDKRERLRFRNEIQKLILERDNYTCQMCGKRGIDLQVDHIQSWADYVELRFCIDNCRTLCKPCHYQITFGRPIPDEKMEWGNNLGRVRIDL